ncbi:MAG: hypothetical protein PHU25_15050 [Deltaproteobacteria bacterium]|nr:hypothetical protein [Deltaproteobacteria bacterium]
MARIAFLVVTLALALAVAPTARAEDQTQEAAPATAPAPAAIPDASFRAMKDHVVKLGLQDGAEIDGRLIAFEAQSVTLVVFPTNEVITFERKGVVSLRAVEPVAAPAPIPAAGPAPVASAQEPIAPAAVMERHFAVNIGIPPELAIDLDYGYFYAFGDVSIVFPAATDGDWVPMSFGMGVNFPPASNKSWKLEVFAQYSPMREGSEEWIHAFGVGLGVHYTADSGLTFGFKTPIFGYSAKSGSYSDSGGSSGEAVAMYYLASGVGLPLASLGYRF